MSETLATLDAAETIARAYGDTETAHRLTDLAADIQEAEGVIDDSRPLPICSICGGNVDIAPRVQCQECSFVYST